MASYISSNANRFYVATETNYGQAAAVTSANRFPAVGLAAQQVLEQGTRYDKTGSRTYVGVSKNARRQTAFEVRTYLASWNGAGTPSYGPLFQGAMGGQPQLNNGLVIASVPNGVQLQTTGPHGLSLGSAVSNGSQIRFVTAIPDPSTLVLNAPFSTPLLANSALAPTVTYKVTTALPSLTLYDYWDPAGAVNRIVTGAAVNSFELDVNGDYHEFIFSGPAADLLDSASFTAGSAALASYPSEPAIAPFDYSIVPGHLGEAWLGTPTNQFYTLTTAKIDVKNNIAVRNKEFGSPYPRAIAPGSRQVSSQFTVFSQTDAQTQALYQAAKLRIPVPAMLQLGIERGQLMGIFLPNVTPEIPNFNDSDTRLQWEFKNNRAQGSSDDEIYIAFA
jgi:hypothetical protein